MAAIAGVSLALASVFRTGLARMALTWVTTEEYSHGLVIPLLCGWLIWQRRAGLPQALQTPSWWGVPVIVTALALNVLGLLATVYSLQQYAFVLCLYGLVLCLGGWRLLRMLAAPLLLLLFMVPLPNFFTNNLSAELQLLSSRLGVWFMHTAGISVFLDGNVIDLGGYQLEVAEACSGLRYLFPLMTLGVVMAYLFQAAAWKRLLLFASSVPLTILMNSLRIAAIGMLVDRWGIGMARGLLHDVEGWMVFMLTAGVMLGEVAVLARFGSEHGAGSWRVSLRSLRDPGVAARGTWPTRLSRSALTAGLMLVLALPLVATLDAAGEQVPVRMEFAQFPQSMAEWRGQRTTIDRVFLDVLQLDDYIMADYRPLDRADEPSVNLYIAWYQSQRSGQSAHSPRSCLPGGGWHIDELQRADVVDVRIGGVPLRVNRAVIQKGPLRQLVYYWFQQRGRIITNEYQVKWYLFWDALTRHRTDGALVRMIVAVPEGVPLARADRELQRFASAVAHPLESYVPG